MRRQAGFSLIELMAVIFVIGLSLSMVSLTVSTGSAETEVMDEIEKFMGLAQFANEKAILSGEAMGLMLEPPLWQAQRGQNLEDIGWKYRWVSNSSQGWQEVPNLPAVSLPASMQLVVEIDETVWKYESQLDRQVPIAAYYSSGDVSPIAIEISDKRERGFVQHIEVDETGNLVWLEAPQPPEADENGF